MTTAAIRERLYDYIRKADDDRIKNIYALFEAQMTSAVEWSEDEEFVAELNDRVRRWEAGIDRSYSLEGVKAELAQLKAERSSFLDQYNKELDESEAQIDTGDFYTQDEVKKILADRRKRISGN